VARGERSFDGGALWRAAGLDDMDGHARLARGAFRQLSPAGFDPWAWPTSAAPRGASIPTTIVVTGPDPLPRVRVEPGVSLRVGSALGIAAIEGCLRPSKPGKRQLYKKAV
jgi:hypothetical protein